MAKYHIPVMGAIVGLLLFLAGCGIPGSTKPAPLSSGNQSGALSIAPAAAIATPAHFTAVDFITPDTGWVAGYDEWTQTGLKGNKLLHTADGGRTWATSNAPDGSVLQIHFTDPVHGWMITWKDTDKKMTVWASVDGGKTWRRQWQEPSSQIMDNLAMQARAKIFFSGSQNGYILAGGILLATTNGGGTWKPVSLPAKFTPVDMSFTGFQKGWVAGQEGTGTSGANSRLVVLVTVNGGQSWERSFFPPNNSHCLPFSASLSFATSEDGWLFYKDDAMNGILYHTVDGGKRWELEQTALASGRTLAVAMVFTGSNAGWLPVDSGAAPLPGGILITRDGGRNWQPAGFDKGWSIEAVSPVSSRECWAIGELPNIGNFLIHTTDGGKTWRQLLPALRPTSGISFSDPGNGTGIGLPSDWGAVLRTADGGKSWTEINSPGARPLAVSFPFPKEGWIVAGDPGDPGRILLRTSDGGSTWDTIARLTLKPDMLAPYQPYLQFFNRQAGLWQTADWPSVILAGTADGGKTWQKQMDLRRPPGSSAKICFTSPRHGFAVLETSSKTGPGQRNGYNLMKTADGGRTWTTVKHLDRSYWVQCLSFVTPEDGWILAARNPFTNRQQNEVMHTSDGGATWQETPLEYDTAGDISNFVQMTFVNAKDGWILARDGIQRTRDGGRTWQKCP